MRLNRFGQVFDFVHGEVSLGTASRWRRCLSLHEKQRRQAGGKKLLTVRVLEGRFFGSMLFVLRLFWCEGCH